MSASESPPSPKVTETSGDYFPKSSRATSTATTTTTTTTTTTSTTNDDVPEDRLTPTVQDTPIQIFLGGSCNPTTWRKNIAIPYLETKGLTYYNPQIDDWTPEIIKIERQAKQNAKVLLFVIDKQTRSTVSLVESAYMAGANKRLVLVIYPFEYDVLSLTDTTTKQTSNRVETRSELSKTSSLSMNKFGNLASSLVQSSSSTSTVISKHSSGTIRINDEVISLGEFQELRRARYILRSLVTQQKIPMFSDLNRALEYVSCSLHNDDKKDLDRCEESCRLEDLDLEQDLKESARTTCIQQNPTLNPSLPQTDIYLTLDDDTNTRSTVIPYLEENGLTFNCMPLEDILEPVKTPAFPKLERQGREKVSISDLRETFDKYPEALDLRDNQQAETFFLEKEIQSIQKSRVLLFVVTKQSRGLSIMVLASHFMALFRDNVVLCIQYLEEPCTINGEALTKSAVADYNRGRVYLCDYAIKSRVPVFNSIREAIDCCSQKCGYINETGGTNKS